jgi:hypothetical protein
MNVVLVSLQARDIGSDRKIETGHGFGKVFFSCFVKFMISLYRVAVFQAHLGIFAIAGP